jgi:hypothetical protein
MIDSIKLELFTLPEQWDYLRGVEYRLEESIRRDHARCSTISRSFGDTSPDYPLGQIWLEESSEFAKKVTQIISSNHELTFVRSRLVSVKEEHYRQTQELLG